SKCAKKSIVRGCIMLKKYEVRIKENNEVVRKYTSNVNNLSNLLREVGTKNVIGVYKLQLSNGIVVGSDKLDWKLRGNLLALKIVNKMVKTGYRGVVGIDYIVTDKGIFPVENNARFNGSSYVSIIVDNIKKLTTPIPVWKFMKINTTPCSFIELKERLKSALYDGVRTNSIFPFNSKALPDTGSFSLILLAENIENISILEQIVKEKEIIREVFI
ncbi:hypothetical protein LCGC14_2315680, partial [marine sediment metagenome]